MGTVCVYGVLSGMVSNPRCISIYWDRLQKPYYRNFLTLKLRQEEYKIRCSPVWYYRSKSYLTLGILSYLISGLKILNIQFSISIHVNKLFCNPFDFLIDTKKLEQKHQQALRGVEGLVSSAEKFKDVLSGKFMTTPTAIVATSL